MASDEDWQRAERALRRAVQVVAAHGAASERGRLGFARVPLGRMMNRTDYWTAFSIARETGLTIDEVVQQVMRKPERSGPSVDEYVELYGHLVRACRPGQREPVIAKLLGWSWKRIVRTWPGRAFFSLQDDYLGVISRVRGAAGDLIARCG